MDAALRSLLTTYNYIQQPVFFSQDGVITYCNHPAQELFVHTGNTLTEILGEEAALLTDLQQDTPTLMPLSVAGSRLQANILQIADGLLFIFTPEAQPVLSSQILSSVAQAVRTPLSNLFGVAASLFPTLEELEDPATQQDVASLERAFYQLLHVTCNLAELPNVLDRKLRIAREKTELCGFFHDIFERAQELCDKTKVQLSCSLPEKTFCAWIDRQKVSRAVWNLLSNAIKYTPAGGHVRMALTRTEKSAVFRITDNGEGMDPSLLSRAFRQYAQPQQPTDPRCGIGFGLAYVQQVVQLHGGTVVLQAQPDAGTDVILSLPLAQPESMDPALHSPIMNIDYAGGHRHELVELADVLPLDSFKYL